MRTDPAGSSYFGSAILMAFVAVQLCDAAFTYVGIRAHGVGIEANPILASSMRALGPVAALALMKSLAVVCAGVLYLLARYRTIGMLTIVYLVFALWPWSRLLSARVL